MQRRARADKEDASKKRTLQPSLFHKGPGIVYIGAGKNTLAQGAFSFIFQGKESLIRDP